MNLETTRPRGRPRNRWLDEVREDGRMVGGEEWQEKVYDREELKRLLRTARNHRILYMPVDWLIDMDSLSFIFFGPSWHEPSVPSFLEDYSLTSLHAFSFACVCLYICQGADKSLAWPGRKQARKRVRDGHDFNNTEMRAVIKFFFPARQGTEGNLRHSDRNISLFPSWSG